MPIARSSAMQSDCIHSQLRMKLNMQAIQHLKVVSPTNEKRTVASPRRKANADYRQREHLTEREVESWSRRRGTTDGVIATPRWSS